MSDKPNLLEDVRFAGVVADLENIRRELVKTGKLVSLTGTTESDIAIEFADYGEGKQAEPSILLKVVSSEDFDGDEVLLEDFEDCVIGMLEVASREWSREVTDLLGDDRQIILLINGEEY